MTRESEWRKEWELLRAERDAARHRWKGAAGALAQRARDPFGLRRFLHEHPVAAAGAATGIGAAVVALLVKRFSGRRRARATDDGADREDAAQPSPIPAALRDAALGMLAKWLTRFVSERFGRHGEPDAAAQPEHART